MCLLDIEVVPDDEWIAVVNETSRYRGSPESFATDLGGPGTRAEVPVQVVNRSSETAMVRLMLLESQPEDAAIASAEVIRTRLSADMLKVPGGAVVGLGLEFRAPAKWLAWYVRFLDSEHACVGSVALGGEPPRLVIGASGCTVDHTPFRR